MSVTFEIGRGKASILTNEWKDKTLFGYGKPSHTAKVNTTDLFARSIWFRPETKQKVQVLCIVVIEALCVSNLVRQLVLEEIVKYENDLYLTEENLILTATHTHAAPGGFSGTFFHDISCKGIQHDVIDAMVKGIVESILQTRNNRQENVTITDIHASFPLDVPVAFNRSLSAYKRNPEVDQNLNEIEATDRIMKMWKFSSPQTNIGNLLSINWFGSHCTCISNKTCVVCSDSKGFAAMMMENQYGTKNNSDSGIHIFAQDCAGDITPNGCQVSRPDDDVDWAKEQGKLLSTMAKAMLQSSNANMQSSFDIKPIINIKNVKNNSSHHQTNTIIRCSYEMVDFMNLQIYDDDDDDDEYQNDNDDEDRERRIRSLNMSEKKKTGEPCLGMSFIRGTKEGSGVHKVVCDVLQATTEFSPKALWRKFMSSVGNGNENGTENKNQSTSSSFKTSMTHSNFNNPEQDPKCVAINLYSGKIMGGAIQMPMLRNWMIPFSKKETFDLYNKTPWVDTLIPFQLIIFGQVAFFTLPFEVTVISGHRLRDTITKTLNKGGILIHRVQIMSYSNAYVGYLTTPEEYDEQLYEGGHTLFGKWSLDACKMIAKRLCAKVL